MNNINLLKRKRLRCEDDDICFYSNKFLQDPVEAFHPLIGFVTISKDYEKDFYKFVQRYENKHKN